ncbi:subtilisin-like protein [Colletotrichum zoysiae]|uniref:Subtilisin-like protein n=1 Tax=Colletotrichum zoysiae TaxID=1216348 RepID=A0AAD9H9Q3_9PEZI|nr:subtilisin-like protein [Colletotrichum zoysiae]
MHLESVVCFFAILSLGSIATADPNPNQTGSGKQLYRNRHVARQQLLSTTTRSVPPTQPHVTPAPTFTPTTTGSSTPLAPAAYTLSNGEAAIAIIGATYAAGIGGAVLMIGGTAHPLAAGMIARITGGGPNGDTPEVEIEDSNPVTTTSSSASSSSSAEPTPIPSPYIILFSPNATAQEIQSVNSTLVNHAAPNSLSEVVSHGTGLVVFFKAGINPNQADAIRQAPGVGGVFLDETLGVDQLPSSEQAPLSFASRRSIDTDTPGSPKASVRNPADIKLQSDAVNSLKVISQPAGAKLTELPGYGYAEEAGKGVTIYVIDTGVNAINPEWSSMPGHKDILYAPGAAKTKKDFLNHGSCVASKAGGPVYGTAKNADMVVVKVPRHLHTSAVFTAILEVSNDIFKKKLKGKAVINMSLGHLIPDELHSAYEQLLDSLTAMDVVIVTASGNDAEKGVNDVTHYPALLGPTTDIIVVGAVDNAGYRAPFSQGSGIQLNVSAPGYVDCANGKAHPDTQGRWGTSFAAPAVAGVIAVWLSQDEYKAKLQVEGQVAARVKKMVQDLAYSRVEGQPPVIWNGIDPRGLSCASDHPTGFIKVFEKDGVASGYYDVSSNSTTGGVTENIEQWCLAKCTGPCVSVFLYRIRQSASDGYYICNQYNQPWTNNLVQTGVAAADSGVVFTKSLNRRYCNSPGKTVSRAS